MWCFGMRRKGIVRAALLAAILLALTGGLLLYAGSLRREYGGISLRISDTPVTEKKLKRLMAEEDDLAPTAAWSRGKAVTAAAEGFDASAQARHVKAYGDIRQICPMRLLSGGYLVEGDLRGCLITADVAMALFHSVDANGVRVLVDGKQYAVRGVVSAYEPMVITRADDGTAYENLEFTAADVSGGAARVEAFLYRHGLSSAHVIVQSGMYARILYGLAWLPGAFACLSAAMLCIRACRRRRSAAALWRLLPAAGALLLLLLLKNTFYWPQIYLPTKCADFAFWRELLTDWRESWKAMALAAPLPKDIQFYQAARVLVCGTFLAVLTEGALYRRILALTRVS